MLYYVGTFWISKKRKKRKKTGEVITYMPDDHGDHPQSVGKSEKLDNAFNVFTFFDMKLQKT